MLFERGSMPSGPPVETRKALLLIDFQRDFTEPDGNLPVQNVVPFLNELLCLVPEFRCKGQVIWVSTEFVHPRSSTSAVTGSHSIVLKQQLSATLADEATDEQNVGPDETPSHKSELVHDREAFLAPVMTSAKHRCCVPGSSGARMPLSIESAVDKQHDFELVKSHYSAFEETNLLILLRINLITELYVCGSLSNIGIHATVLDAVCHGIQVTLIEDCLGYIDEPCHVEAMMRMADTMGARGIDCQELRDDLAGLLGEIVREEDFPTQFQVSLAPSARPPKSRPSEKQIREWISGTSQDQDPESPLKVERILPKKVEPELTEIDSRTARESLRQPAKHISSGQNSSRKRSTGDLDSIEEHCGLKSPLKSHRRTSVQVEQTQTSRKRRSLLTPPDQMFTTSPSEPLRTFESSSTGPEVPANLQTRQYAGSSPEIATKVRPSTRQRKKQSTIVSMGFYDKIGSGDSTSYPDVLDSTEAEQAFQSCKHDTQWQKMFHRTGEVPRLIAEQGTLFHDGSRPIYRHPADELPKLHPFDSVVDMLRKAAERLVGHPLNHALIQFYRTSEDNISEHSDKTLDIVRGSSVVNLSLGAQRTMILRKKRSTVAAPPETEAFEASRPSQRVPMPHNSLFVLGPNTNRDWLHSIRADKRLFSEKSVPELAFEGERISFTFRHIGTFIDPEKGTIWGQGATAKTKDDARPLLAGAEAEDVGQNMINAFGQENHQSTAWSWQKCYGLGFDVVNFQTKKDEQVQTKHENAEQEHVDG